MLFAVRFSKHDLTILIFVVTLPCQVKMFEPKCLRAPLGVQDFFRNVNLSRDLVYLRVLPELFTEGFKTRFDFFRLRGIWGEVIRMPLDKLIRFKKKKAPNESTSVPV